MPVNYPLPYRWNNSRCNIVTTSDSVQGGCRSWPWLRIVIVLQLLSTQHFLYAESGNGVSGTDKIFYQQLILLEDGSRDNSHLITSSRFQTFISELPANTETVDFNQLWIQQQQPNYRHKDGGAALGSLLRMGAKAFYHNYYGGKSIAVADTEEDFNGNQANLEYRLRVSDDEMKLNIEYDF